MSHRNHLQYEREPGAWAVVAIAVISGLVLALHSLCDAGLL